MKRYTLVRQIAHDVINTLSCLLFEHESVLAMECVFQLRIFQGLEESIAKDVTAERFLKMYREEIGHFTKSYSISLDIDSISDSTKQVLFFLLLNKKSCSITVYEDKILFKNCKNFDCRIFESDNGVLNYIGFRKKFLVTQDDSGFLVSKISS